MNTHKYRELRTRTLASSRSLLQKCTSEEFVCAECNKIAQFGFKIEHAIYGTDCVFGFIQSRERVELQRVSTTIARELSWYSANRDFSRMTVNQEQEHRICFKWLIVSTKLKTDNSWTRLIDWLVTNNIPFPPGLIEEVDAVYRRVKNI